MKQKGKSVKTEQQNTKFISNSNYFHSSSDLPCKKHPLNLSSVGICAYCLNEKLIELVCSKCGEQRLCSCSCSDFDSHRNSSCTIDIGNVGSVGRISFLIENEKVGNFDESKTLFSHMKLKQSKTEDVVLFKRSNSCVVEVKKRNVFWKFGNLFKKKSEDYVMDVSRSRSISSFHEIGSIACSSAKSSDFGEFEVRKNGINGGLRDYKSWFKLKESDFRRIDDDDEFIDLKIDLVNKSKTEYSVSKECDLPEGNGSLSGQIVVNKRGIKKVKIVI